MRRSISVGLVAIALAFGAANTASADPFSDGYAAYERADYPMALRIWEPLAKKGDRVAQFYLGVMHDEGEGVPQNYAEAVKWYRLAAEQGDAKAQTNLGFMHYKGQGVPQNYAEAVKWFRLAAEQGHADAQFYLGLMHYKRQGVPWDFDEMVKWYRLAAEQGDADAQFTLGNMYADGQAVPPGSEADKWFRLTADQAVEAVKWFRLAADQGLASAQYELWAMYKRLARRRDVVLPDPLAVEMGVPQNYVAAVKCPDSIMVRWHNCYGRLTFANGDKYAGEFMENNFHGRGIYTFADGSKYTGEFKENAKRGHGTHIYANGSKYIGEFKNGKQLRRKRAADGIGNPKDCLKERCDSDELAQYKPKNCLKEECDSGELAHYMVTKEKDDVARLWEVYSKRQKSLIEQVLNYSTTALVEGYHEREVSPIVRNFGSSSAFWVEAKEGSGKCTATLIEFHTVSTTFAAMVAIKRISSEIERNPTMRNKIILGQIENNIRNRKNIEIKKLNIGGFRIEEIRDCPSQGNCDGRPIRQYRFGDEQQNFTAPNNEQLMSRMKSAWQLAFKECPGTRTPF